MGFLVDTSAAIALERCGDAVPRPDSRELYISAISIAELWIGIELAPTAKTRQTRLAKIGDLLEQLEPLPFHEEMAPTYARLYAALRRQGTPIPANDLAIATTAVHHGLELLVGPAGEAHFSHVPELRVCALPAEPC